MTIQKKKGIAVLKGVDVVHKLTGEDATIGKEGSTITLSGTIGVESSTGDVVSMFASRDASRDQSRGLNQQWMQFAQDDHDAVVTQIENLTASALAANEAQYTTFVGQGNDHATAVTGIYNTHSSSLAQSAAEAEGKIATEITDFTTNKNELNTAAAALETRVTTLDNSAVVSNITGVESLIIAASSSQSGDLATAVISLNTEIANMVSDRQSGDATLDSNIAAQTTAQNNTVTSLATEVADEQTANATLSNAFALSWADDKTSLTTRYVNGDNTVSTNIDGVTKSRIMGDASLSSALSVAVQTMTNAVDPLNGSWTLATEAEEDAETVANSEASTSIIAAGQAGHTDDLRDYGDNPNSVVAETDLRISAFASLSDQVKADYDTQWGDGMVGFQKEIGDIDNFIANKESNDRLTADNSIATTELQAFIDQQNGAVGYTASLESRISTEEANENAAVVATDLLAQAQEDRLAALQDHDTDTFAEISTMVSSMSGSEATALSQEVSDVVGSLGTLATNRTTGDGDESDYLTNTVIANRTTDQVAMQSLIDDAEAEMVADEGEHTSFLATEKTSLQSELNTWDTTTLSLAESTMTSVREEGDATLSSALSTAISTREDIVSTQKSLQEDGDAALSTRLDNLAVSWNGQDMTLSGHLSVGGNLAVSGEVKLGVHTTVPAAYSAGPQAGNNGAIFYLDADDDAARVGFEKGHSWYFCENDVWFASPFSTEELSEGGGEGEFADPQEAYDILEAAYFEALPLVNAADPDAYAVSQGFADAAEMAQIVDEEFYAALTYLMGGGHHANGAPFPFSGGDEPFANVMGVSNALYALYS